MSRHSPVRSTAPLDDCIPLTSTQRSLASSSSESRMVILAGPGSGKTHVVAARLAYLVLGQGLKPHSEVLMISYTRTAVREMHNRMGTLARTMGNTLLETVDIRTMDSFSYQLHVAAETPYPAGGFDDGIRSGSALLEGNKDVRDYVRELRHVIVDEAQDLYGERDLFVRSLLGAVGGGFTVLADPDQAIYDYLAEDENLPAGTGWEYLQGWLKDSAHAATKRLGGTHRHQGRVKTLVARAAGHLHDPNLEWDERYNHLVGLLGEEGIIGKSDLVDTLRQAAGRSAVLARSNGQALEVADYLLSQEHPLPFRLGGVRSRSLLVGWIARVIPSLPEQFNRQDFVRVWKERVGSASGADGDPGEAFNQLISVCHVPSSDHVDRRVIEEQMRMPYHLPMELTLDGSADPVISVSTVHRAKGREFDNVFLVEPTPPEGEGMAPMETRVLYVALSRPKARIALVRFSTYSRKKKNAGAGEGRFYVRPYRHVYPPRFEIKPEDVEYYSVATGKGAADRQEAIWELKGAFLQARPAGSISGPWSLFAQTDSREPLYLASLRAALGVDIGTISYFDMRMARPPAMLYDIWMEDVATFVPDKSSLDSQRAKLDPLLSERGYWLVPVIRGLAGAGRPPRREES